MRYNEKMVETWISTYCSRFCSDLLTVVILDCYYCYNDTAATGKSMELQDYLTLMKDLEQMGTMNLALSGGEPLAHPHFFEIGRAAREAGFVVRVKSNAHAMRYDMAKRVRDEIDPFSVEVSLHGMCADTHDRQTRVPGSFDLLMKNLRVMKDLGLRIQLNSTMTTWNENEFEGMYAIADELEVKMQMDTRVTPKDNGDREPLQIYPSLAGIENLMKVQKQRAGIVIAGQLINEPAEKKKSVKPKHHCGAGTGNVIIDPFGDVFPCVEWRRHVGNLHEDSIQQIWAGSKQLNEVRQISRDVNNMVNCANNEVDKVGFCPAIAEKTYGSHDVLDKMTQFKVEVMQKQD